MGQARDNESAEWLKKGNELYVAEQYEEAISYFHKVLEIQPDNYEIWRKLGIALSNLDRHKEAIDSYNQAIKIKPDFDKTWSNRGVALYNLGRHEESIASYDQVIKIDPDNHEAWSNRGGILCALGQCEEAVVSSDRAIEIKPDNHDAWVNRGVALKILGRYAEAIASYDRAIEIKFDKYEAWSNRGTALGDLGRYQDAITSFDRAVEIRPDKDEDWNNRGFALGDLGRYEDAIASYDRAIEINPDNHEACFNRGVALGNLGRYEDAIASYDRAIEINPDCYEIWYNRAIALGILGQDEDVIASFNRAIKIKSDDPDAWSNQGAALLRLKRYQDAIASYDRAVEIRPDKDEAWNNRGFALGNLGRYEDEIASYDRAIKIKPNDHEYWHNRGLALLKLERYGDAISSYDRAIKINHDYHEAWSDRGIALENLGRYEDAINSCDQAIRIKSDYHEAFSNRGSALKKLERYEGAIASYDRAIEINPDDHDYWHNRGIALFKLERYEDAISNYDRAIKIKPDYHEALSNQGNSLLRLERYEDAISSYDRAIDINPDDHQYLFNRGVALRNLGRYVEAIASYDRAIEIKPDLYEAWFNRGIAIGILHGYKAEIQAYSAAFKHIDSETHPEGWGNLQHRTGRTHYEEGNNQLLNYRRNSERYYDLALTHYHKALTALNREAFPTLRLETLIDTAKAYLAQKNPSAASECQTEALTIWLKLIDAEASPQGKKRLYLEYSYLLRTQVDLSILDGEPIRALEIAEFDKNNHLEWFLCAQEQQGQTASLILEQIEQLRLNVFSLQYSQMRQLLTPNQAIVYWHFSPDHLTTFILHPDRPNPEVLTSSSQQLRDWLKTYDTANLDTTNWQELSNILQISKINHHLDGIQHLILIPHRDLHRLPLHTCWSNLTTTYLPSIQVGLNLKNKPKVDRSAGFLLVESPDYNQATKLKSITKSFDPLTNPKVESAIIAHLFQPKTTISTGAVRKELLCAAFNIPHTYGHFNGHAFHDSRRPQDSSLVIDGGELTCQDLAQIDLTPYYLISLSACETGITAHQSIDTEYVGLVSAFLSRGTNYVVSTLWSVKDLPSSLLMMTFYLYLKQGNSAPLALYKAAHWLKNLTYEEEAEFHRNVYKHLPQNSPAEQSTVRTTDRNRRNAEALAKEQPEAKPYSSPYYWAAFTISGWG